MDQLARLLSFMAMHPEVRISVLGPGVAIAATVPGKPPLVRTSDRLGELLDELESQ